MSSLLFSRQCLFIGWSKLFLFEKWIRMTDNISNALSYRTTNLPQFLTKDSNIRVHRRLPVLSDLGQDSRLHYRILIDDS